MKKSFMKRLVALALVIVSVFSMSAVAFAEYNTMYINCPVGQTVRLREGPGTSYDVLTNISSGTAVQAEYYNSSWYTVKYNGYTGYMMESFLSSTPVNLSTMYVNCTPGQTVRLREEPNTEADVLKNISHGTAVQAAPYNTSWYVVQYAGYTGYMMSNFLTANNPGSNSGSSTEEDTWQSRYTTTDFVLSDSRKNGVKNFQDDLNYFFDVLRPDKQPANWQTLTEDGIYGTKSVEATLAFQKLYSDLVDDGIAGSGTKAKLHALTLANHE